MEFESLGHSEQAKTSLPLREMPSHSVPTPPPGADRPQVQAPVPLKPALKKISQEQDVLTRDFAVGGAVEKPENSETKGDNGTSDKPLFKESVFGKKEDDRAGEDVGVEHIESAGGAEDLKSPTKMK